MTDLVRARLIVGFTGVSKKTDFEIPGQLENMSFRRNEI